MEVSVERLIRTTCGLWRTFWEKQRNMPVPNVRPVAGAAAPTQEHQCGKEKEKMNKLRTAHEKNADKDTLY